MAFPYFNALQVALAAAALVLIARRLRVLLFEAPLDTAAFLGALETALEAGQVGLARELAKACLPAWPARLAAQALAEPERTQPTELALDETYTELAQALWQDRDVILACGRMASPLAFIGVIIEAGSAAGGGEGLIGLQRGLAASIALQHSVLTFALGIGTTLVCFSAVSLLGRRAGALHRDLDRINSAIAALARRNEM